MARKGPMGHALLLRTQMQQTFTWTSPQFFVRVGIGARFDLPIAKPFKGGDVDLAAFVEWRRQGRA